MAKRKIKIKRLPKGYKLANGEVIKTMALGGVPRDKANLEAEKGETVLTDLDNDGAHELYNIGGNRHSEGGTPLSLPPQSFIFSDTAKMKFSTDELAELGLDSKKKQTPAWASKRFKLNKFIKNMDSEHSDKISDETSELMLDKNKLQLSKIAFMAEAKKDFLDEEGNISVPLAAYPFLISKGIDPKEFIAKLEEIKAAKEKTQQAPLQSPDNREQAMQQPAPQLQDFTGGPQGPQQGPPQGPQQGPSQGVQEIIARVIEALQQGMQPEQIMQQLVKLGIPEEQAMALLQKVIQDVQGQQGPPQGMSAQGPPPPMPPQGGPSQGGMPPEMMMAMQQQGQGMPPQGPPPGMIPPPGMARYGGSLPSARHGDEQKYAQFHDLSQADYDVAVSNLIAKENADAINLENRDFGTIPHEKSHQIKDEYGNPTISESVINSPVHRADLISNLKSSISTGRGLPLGRATRAQFSDPWGNVTPSTNVEEYIPSGPWDKTFTGSQIPLSEFVYGGDAKPCYECGGHVPKFQGERGPSEYTDQRANPLPQQCQELVIIRQQLLQEIDPFRESGWNNDNRDVVEGLHKKLQQVDRDIQKCMVENVTPQLEEEIIQQPFHEAEEFQGTKQQFELQLVQRIHQIEMMLQMSPNMPIQAKQQLLQQYYQIKNHLAQLRMGSAGGPGNQHIWDGGGKEKVMDFYKKKYGGDPFATNPLHKFVYGGSLPKAQKSEETTDPCDPALQAKCEAAASEGATWVKSGTNCQCKCPEGLDWMGSGCVVMGGVIDDETEIDLSHDHNDDGIPDHDAADHVGESHGAKGDVDYTCTDVDANGECISYQTAYKTHTTFEDVMRHEDFGTARDVWWDVYTKGRKDMSGEGESFHIGDNEEHFKEGTKEEMIDNYFLYNQILHDLDQHNLDPGDAGGKFYEHAKSLGYFQNGETEDEVKTMSMNFQGMYRALNIAKRTEATSGLFTNIETLPEGEDWETDEHRDQWGNPVSSIDAKIGKTSKRQFSSAVNPIITPEKDPPCPGKPMDFDVEAARIACEKKNALAVDAEGTTKGGVTDAYMWNAHNCECEHAPGDYIPPDRVPMIPWRQDQNNLTNSIMNKSMREDFYPMMEQYNFTPADMLRDDPLSRIHASNSLAQTAIDAGADPYTIFSQAAAENRKSIADVQSRDVAEYNALDRANMTGKQTIDQANMLARKQYVDDVNTVGTNRINTQIADNENIVKMQNALLTNAQNTQMMNQLRPNYNINPQATPWNNQSLIEFANAKAYQDEVGGGGGGTVGMSFAEAFTHASTPKPDGLGLDNTEANIWAKNYIAANKGNSSNFASGYGTDGNVAGYPARYGGERQRRRSGAALRQWMRGGMK